jgi:hypothetical protein
MTDSFSFWKKLKTVFLILGLFLLIYLIHISGYISASCFQKQMGFKGGSFNMTTLKGDQGFSLDIATYMSQIRNSWNEGFSVFQRDPFIKENAGLNFPNGNLVYAAVSFFYFFTSSPIVVYFISVFFSILISVFLLYRITILLTDNAVNSKMVFIVSICLLYLSSFDSMLTANNFLINLKGSGVVRNLGYTGRFPNIEFSLVFLIFWFYRWVKCLKTPTVANWILLGLALAVLQYCYFYFWTGACFFTGIHLFFSSVRNRTFFKKSLWIFGTYFIFTLPFWIKFFQFNHTDFAKEFTVRCRQIHTHAPQLFSKIFFFSMVAFGLDFLTCYLKNRKFNLQLFIQTIKESELQLYLFFSVYILLNIQVLAGITIQNYHWEVAFFYPVFILLFIPYLTKAAELLKTLFKNGSGFKKIAFYTIVLFITASALLNNIRFGKLYAPFLYLSAAEKELIDKIKKDIPENSVLMSNSFSLMGLINANSNVYTYIPYSFVSNCSDAELTGRLVNGFKTMGYTSNQLQNEMKKGEKWLTFLSSENLQKMTFTNGPASIPDNFLSLVYVYGGTYYDNKLKDYVYTKSLEEKIENAGKENLFQKNELDYFIIYKSILPHDYVKPVGPVLIFENSAFEIYKLKV